MVKGTDPLGDDAVPLQDDMLDDIMGEPLVSRGLRRRASAVILTPRGAVVFELLITVVGAVANKLATGGIGWIFACAFVGAAVLCSWLARSDARLPAIVTLPLAYALGLAVAIAMGAGTAGGGWYEALASFVVLLALDPVPLFIGLLAAIVLALLRHWLTRHRARRRSVRN